MTVNVEPQLCLEHARDALGQLRFPIALPRAEEAVQRRDAACLQISDYLLPRVQNLGAPALAVIGGSTGSGKSTLLNSLLGYEVSTTGPLRPTTRTSVLVATEADEQWFSSGPVLPGLRRVPISAEAPQPNRIMFATCKVSGPLVPGFALLDAPDIDSFEDSNRALAAQLLDAADLWVFVTTAARYADQAVWDVLMRASDRNVSVAVVLNRVPPESADAVETDLRNLLGTRGLENAPVFTIPECTLDRGLVPEPDMWELADWLHSVGADREARESLIKQTLVGATTDLASRIQFLIAEREQQEQTLKLWQESIDEAYEQASSSVMATANRGALLRSEVLMRWQDLIGTSDIVRTLEGWVGSARDRMSGWLRGHPPRSQEVQDELTGALVTLMVEENARSTQRLWRQLHATTFGAEAFSDPELVQDLTGAKEEAVRLVREWQGQLVELIRKESPQKRQRARYLSLGLNTVTIALMLAVFASTGGLLGGEIAVAGGSAVIGQKLLETVFGDQAVRSLSKQGLLFLEQTMDAYFTPSKQRFVNVVIDNSGGTSAADLERVKAKVERLAHELE